MPVDRSYVAENERERRRLEALVAKLDDAALGRPMPAGWTVAAVLLHLAFWDERTVILFGRLRRGEKIPAISEADVDWINDAAKPAQLAVPPRRAAEIAVAAARAADEVVARFTEEDFARNAATGSMIRPQRSDHRKEHLDEIEHALGR
jgi:hypothetical protein